MANKNNKPRKEFDSSTSKLRANSNYKVRLDFLNSRGKVTLTPTPAGTRSKDKRLT